MSIEPIKRLRRSDIIALTLAAILVLAGGIYLWQKQQARAAQQEQLACGLAQLGDAYRTGTYDEDECDD